MATMKTLNGYGFNATELNGKTSDSYLQKTDTASDTSKLGGKAPEYYLQPRNLLDNSDFRNPVNQRGATSYSGTGYKGNTIDRWRLYFADSTGQLDVTSSGIKFTLQDDNAYFDELLDLDTSKTYTFAAMVNGELSLISGVPDNNVNNGVILLGKNGNGHLRAGFCKKGEETIVTWAALYEGSYTADTLPPYVPKGYAAELAECQRYYQVIPYGMSIFNVATNSEYPSRYPILFPQLMRITPTATLNESWSANIKTATTSFVSDKALCFTLSANSSEYTQWHGSITLSADL